MKKTRGPSVISKKGAKKAENIEKDLIFIAIVNTVLGFVFLSLCLSEINSFKKLTTAIISNDCSDPTTISIFRFITTAMETASLNDLISFISVIVFALIQIVSLIVFFYIKKQVRKEQKL
jgi:hypothetical protein